MIETPWLAHYDTGVAHTLAPYPEKTLLDFLQEAARERPDHPALLFKGRVVTSGELDRLSDEFAAALVSLGVNKGDRVALMLPNCPQFLIAEFGAWKAGATVAPVNPIYTEEELEGPLRTTGAEIVVALTPFYERLKNVQKKTALKRIVTTNIKEFFPPLTSLFFTLFMEGKGGHRITRRGGDLAMADLMAKFRGAKAPDTRPKPNDEAILLMSGGTTGTPKAVPGRHIDLVMTGLQIRAWVGQQLRDWEDKVLLPLPLFHAAGGAAAQPLCIVARYPLVLVPNPRDLADLLKTLARTRPAGFVGVPTLYNAMLEHTLVKSGTVKFDSLKVLVCGAAPLMAETKKRFEKLTGKNVIEGYGMTESLTALVAVPLEGVSKASSVGIPMPDVQIRVVDADDPFKLVAAGEVGEILLRAPQQMKGYWKSPGETKEMLFTDADNITWLRTADLGHMDADGYLFIVDRKKDLMKPNGMQVWPREVEEAMAAHPAVAEVGVRSFPDPARGEMEVAFVVLRAGMTATEAELRDFAKSHLAPYKVPSRVLFRMELPKSLIGKVLRRKLTMEEAGAVA